MGAAFFSRLVWKEPSKMSTDLQETDMHTHMYIVVVSDAFLEGRETCIVSLPQN